MSLSLRGNAEGFDHTLCAARAKLVIARRMRCDDSYDELCDLVLESVDSALEMTQSGGDEGAWQKCVGQVCGTILIARLRAPKYAGAAVTRSRFSGPPAMGCACWPSVWRPVASYGRKPMAARFT